MIRGFFEAFPELISGAFYGVSRVTSVENYFVKACVMTPPSDPEVGWFHF
jgi:hypothetical protein